MRKTKWRSGDIVRTTRILNQATRPGSPLPEGSIGSLGDLCRVQDRVEVWTFWQGSKLSTVVHTAAERCYGPVRWLSCLGPDVI